MEMDHLLHHRQNAYKGVGAAGHSMWMRGRVMLLINGGGDDDDGHYGYHHSIQRVAGVDAEDNCHPDSGATRSPPDLGLYPDHMTHRLPLRRLGGMTLNTTGQHQSPLHQDPDDDGDHRSPLESVVFR